MLRPAFALITALAIAPAARAQTTAIQPGTWTLEIAFGGGLLEGELRITSPRRDSLEIVLMVSGHQSPVRLTRREGNKLILDSTVPGMDVHYELEFTGDQVSGPFRYGGETGSVTGRRRTTGG